MSLKPSNAGIYQIPTLNVNTLFINGVPFQTFVDDLVAGDQFEQGEIDEIRQIIQYLNTSGLTTEWIVGNNNINATLKTAIDTLTTKLTYLDTTALTESWVVNNDNRNATLKTRIDGNDTSIGLVNTKTQYVTSVQGDDGAATNSTFQVSINDRVKRQMSLSTGTNSISSINNSSTQGSTGNYNQNRILLQAANGQVWSYAHLNTLEAIDKVEIGSAFGVGATTAVNIGARNNRINIGSIDSPEVGATTTVITIGKRTISKNTDTNLQGNFYTGDARWESLTKSSALTWTQLLSLISTSGLPLWVASFALTSSIPNFSYSDLWSMKAVEEAGGLIKNGEVETTQGAKLKTLTVFDTSIGVDIVPKEGTFFAKGHISKTTLLGDIKMQTFNGEICLKANNISPSNINWALTEAMDNVNALKISNNDVELIAGAGADGSQLRISNTTGGAIKLRVGTGKLQANAHDALNVLNSQATSQVQIGNANTTANRYDATTKLIVDQTQLADGIKVCKDAGSVTRINHDNINTPSITLQDNYAGSTTKALYTIENGAKLMYNGQLVGAGGGNTAGGGILYLLSGSNSNTTYTAANLTTVLYTMSATYASRVSTRIQFGNYNAATDYNLFRNRGVIPKGSSNPILSGAYEYAPYLTYTGNVNANFYADCYFFANADPVSSPYTDKLVDKQYESAVRNGTGTLGVNSVAHTEYIKANFNQFTITLQKVAILTIIYLGSSMTWRCEMVDTDNNIVLYTFPNIVLTSAGGGGSVSDLTFNAGSLQTISQPASWTGYRFRFRITLLSGSSGCTWSQSLAQNINNLAYQIPNDPSATYTTPLSMNTGNRVIVTPSAIPVLYSLTMPVTDLEISMFPNPQIETRFYFQQPSGNTNNHTVDVGFFDGTLSHFHTNFNVSTVQAPIGLPDVLFVNSSANTSINMSGNNLTNVGTINATTANLNNYLVKNLTAGTNIGISNNAGNFTINVAPSRQVLPIYVISFALLTTATTITLPDTIDLNVFEVELVLEGLLALSGSSNTYITIYYNGKVTGKQTWNNQLHEGMDFSTAGNYPQSHLNPVFAYIPNYPSIPSNSIQYITSVMRVMKHPDTTNSRTPIITQFNTSVGASLNGAKSTTSYSFQNQIGQIQGDCIDTSPNPLPTLATIQIGQITYSGGGSSFRSSLSGSNMRLSVYVKRRDLS